MVWKVLRCEDYKCCDRWGEGPAMNSWVLTLLETFMLIYTDDTADVCLSQVIKLFCLLRKIRKISTSSLPLSITSFLFYLRSHLLSLTLILDRVFGAKTQTGHKSVARWELRWGECFRLYPPAHRHSQYKYISPNGPFVFLCICRVAPVFSRRQYCARSEWVR